MKSVLSIGEKWASRPEHALGIRDTIFWIQSRPCQKTK
jgi:hypothetical protein